MHFQTLKYQPNTVIIIFIYVIKTRYGCCDPDNVKQIVAVGRKEPYLYHHQANLPNFGQLGQIMGYEEPYALRYKNKFQFSVSLSLFRKGLIFLLKLLIGEQVSFILISSSI